MWLPYSQNQLSKLILGTALLLCPLFTFSQTPTQAPLATPAKTTYPGMIETFEKLIQIDADRFKTKFESLAKNGRYLSDTTGTKNLELDVDFLNSIILHSSPGYLKLASVGKCRLYDTIITDLLKTAEGKIQNVIVSYLNTKGERQMALMKKKDFLNKVVTAECPETPKLIAEFQVKNLDQVVKNTGFDIPTGDEQCKSIITAWQTDARTSYLCQLHEYVKEANQGEGSAQDLAQRKAVSRIIESKLTLSQRDYLENLCTHLDDEKFFCEDFLNISFWNKVANGLEDPIYAQDICQRTVKGGELNKSDLKNCLARMKKETDLCLYPAGSSNGLTPHMDCEAQSLALNYSGLRSNYRDCPNISDQQAVTNLARIILHKTNSPVLPFSGVCSAISSGEVYSFNQRFDNQEKWPLEACFNDKLVEREICYRTFFGQYGNLTESYTNVVAEVLKKTRGADQNTRCEMVSSSEYTPMLLRFKSGCFIVYEAAQCFISHCPHKIMYNDRPVDLIKIRNQVNFDYFANNVRDERFSQHYLLTTDLKLKSRTLNNLSAITTFFKNAKKGIIHGMGCAEELLPSFFKMQSMNQCTPLPFIIDGMIKQDDKTVFVTRTAYDSLQAPRLISWSHIYSTVKSYQQYHPLRLWTLYGLD